MEDRDFLALFMENADKLSDNDKRMIGEYVYKTILCPPTVAMSADELTKFVK